DAAAGQSDADAASLGEPRDVRVARPSGGAVRPPQVEVVLVAANLPEDREHAAEGNQNRELDEQPLGDGKHARPLAPATAAVVSVEKSQHDVLADVEDPGYDDGEDPGARYRSARSGV